MEIKVNKENQEELYEKFKKMIATYMQMNGIMFNATEKNDEGRGKLYRIFLNDGKYEAFGMDLINDPLEGNILLTTGKRYITNRRIKDEQTLVEEFNFAMPACGLPPMDTEQINIEGLDENVDLSKTSGRRR